MSNSGEEAPLGPGHKGKEIKIAESPKKIICRWWVVLSAVAALYLIGGILYPPISYYSETFSLGCMGVVIETIVLIVVLSNLRKLDMFASWKLIAFYAIIVGGSLAMSSLLSSLRIHVGDPQQKNFFLFCILCVFLILFLFNFGLLAVIVDVRFRRACLIGVIMSLINTFMVMAATTFYR